MTPATLARRLADGARAVRLRIGKNLLRRPYLFKEHHLQNALDRLGAATYVEIGVRDGACLRRLSCPLKIGIDPVRHPNLERLDESERFYQTTSDEFFERHAAAVLAGRPVGVALVDGLHELRQVLADVFHLIPHMAPSGVLFLDDVNPPTRARAAEVQGRGPWNGDVWKVVWLLRRHYPQLACFTLDVDQGLGVVAGFGAAGRVPEPPADLVAAAKGLDYRVLADDRRRVLGLVGVAEGERRLCRLSAASGASRPPRSAAAPG